MKKLPLWIISQGSPDRISRIYMAKPIPLYMEAGKFRICSEQTGDLGELMVYF